MNSLTFGENQTYQHQEQQQQIDQMNTDNKLPLKDILKMPDEQLYNYFNFEKSVNNWNDFLQPKFAFESLNELKTVDVDINSRQSYIRGYDFLKTGNHYSSYYELFEDNFRKQLENCDNVNVLHFNSDFNSLWGGINMFFIDNIHQMVPKVLKVINGYDSISSFTKVNKIFDLEKHMNYIWYLSDLIEIEGKNAIFSPIYTNECPSFIKTVFNYQSKENIDNDSVYNYYYSSLCSLNLQTFYLPLRSNYYGKTTSLYNLSTSATDLNFIESDLLFKLDTINNHLPKNVLTNGYIMNFSRNFCEKSFSYSNLLMKSCKLNKHNSSIIYGLKPTYKILNQPMETLMEKVSGINFASEDLFELPISFPRKYYSTTKEGSYLFIKELSVLSYNRPYIDFPLVNMKEFPKHCKDYDMASNKFLSKIDCEKYFEYKEKSEIIFNMINSYKDYAENCLNEFGHNEEEDSDIDS